MKTADGRLTIFAGKSRSGKTAKAYLLSKSHPRVLVFDVEDQWSKHPGFVRVSSRVELLRMCKNNRGNHKIAYVAGGEIREEFKFFCACAFYWGRYLGPCLVVAEELAGVTSPGKALGDWGILLSRGLKRGISIFAISQRWAEADKTAIGNASEFYIFASLPRDQKYLSRETGIDIEKFAKLKPLDFLAWDVASNKITNGMLRF